ncbi:MAG TPA: ABC transporter, partial [Syntrophomonas sp.]|nr:ABC transporter [Syntrophomonas sp.]
TYPQGELALKDVNLNIWPGECVAVIGANGAGKSTLLQIVAGLLPTYKGYVRVGNYSGKVLKAEKINRLVAYLPQNLDNFFLTDTVFNDIALSNQIIARDTEFWLERMNLQGFQEDDPRKLSTGEKHRVAMAAILASNPDLI